MSSPRDLTGEILDGRYRITKLLGEGGMGHVYEAVHVALGRKVAIKTLHPRLAYEAKYRERFIREARSASGIQHPNVVQITDFGDSPNGSVYFVMERLEGRDLGSCLREQGRLPWARARAILVQTVRALGAAHAQGIIHRDIKPGNCFLTTTGAGPGEELVKLLDFGIAKVGCEAEGGEGGPRLTGTGEVFGTASYMAPEQARGEPLDVRSDIYSLGVMAYEMLTGQVPFTGTNAIHVITKHLSEPPRPPRALEPAILPAVEALVLRAMAKDPRERFASMGELESALSAIPAYGEPTPMPAVQTGSGAGVPLPLPAAAYDPSYPPYPSYPPIAAPEPLPGHDVSGELGWRSASGPLVYGACGESTRPPPGRPDQPTSPSISLRASSQTGGSARFTGPIAVDTSPHPLGTPAARPARGAAWVLGTIALVSAVSIGATLMVLRGDADVPRAAASTEAAPSSTVAPASEAAREPAEPSPDPRPVARAEPAHAPGRPSADPPDTSDAEVEVDDSVPDPIDASDLEVEVDVDDSVPLPSGDQPTGPKHLTPACVDRRARAEAALAGRDWKGLLSVTRMASCWPPAEQADRRGMRVQAYADLGRFDECIAAGRGVTNPQIRAAVKTCEEQRAR